MAVRRRGADELILRVFKDAGGGIYRTHSMSRFCRSFRAKRSTSSTPIGIGDIHPAHRPAKEMMISCRHVPRVDVPKQIGITPHRFSRTFFVDITKHWTTKERAISAHSSEIERPHERWIAFFRNGS